MNKQWRLIVVGDEEDLANRAAEYVKDQLDAKPESVLALPTGRTPFRMYGELVRMSQRGEADFSRATAFNLDEFYSLPAGHIASFAYYLKKHFLDLIPIRQVVLLNGFAADPEEECIRVEEELRRLGGLDLAILGIGRNGHIAFNEPGSLSGSRTRLVTLDESSRWASKPLFPPDEEVPCTALTMGISTIISAQSVLLLASGSQKASVLARALCGPVTEDVPASYLQRHPNLTAIADDAAASLLCA